MDTLREFGPDGEIYDDGNIFVSFPSDTEFDLNDPLD
jgi:hypothetical protein